MKLHVGENCTVWIDYMNYEFSITKVPSLIVKPRKILINFPLDLSEVFIDEMQVGFCASTGNLIENHKNLRWTFSNSRLI